MHVAKRSFDALTRTNFTPTPGAENFHRNHFIQSFILVKTILRPRGPHWVTELTWNAPQSPKLPTR